jgi:arylsulfatase A-like enzyme
LFDKKRAYYWDANGEKKLYGDWEPYAQTRQAMTFVDHHTDEPFALFLSWHPPHNWGSLTGYAAPEECLERYDAQKLHLRPTVKDTPRVREMYRGYMAMITSLDRSFGWLMDKLDAKGVTDNTIVVFTADHGDMLLSHDWPNHKGRAEHLSCRVPLIIRFPRQLEPRVSELIVGTFDLMPTLLGMMDLAVPAICEGRDLSAAIVQGRDDVVEYQPLFLLSADWRGIYTRRYTYSYSVIDSTSASTGLPEAIRYNCLYDRQMDLWETSNRYDAIEYADVRLRLHQRTLGWMEEFGDPGFVCRSLLEKALRPKDWAAFSKPPTKRPPGWEGRFKGPPIDFLR